MSFNTSSLSSSPQSVLEIQTINNRSNEIKKNAENNALRARHLPLQDKDIENSNISFVPHAIWNRVVQFLHPKDRMSVRLTCFYFDAIIKNYLKAATLNLEETIPEEYYINAKKHVLERSLNNLDGYIIEILNKQKNGEDIEAILFPSAKPFYINCKIMKAICNKFPNLSKIDFKHAVSIGEDILSPLFKMHRFYTIQHTARNSFIFNLSQTTCSTLKEKEKNEGWDIIHFLYQKAMIDKALLHDFPLETKPKINPSNSFSPLSSDSLTISFNEEFGFNSDTLSPIDLSDDSILSSSKHQDEDFLLNDKFLMSHPDIYQRYIQFVNEKKV